MPVHEADRFELLIISSAAGLKDLAGRQEKKRWKEEMKEEGIYYL